MRGPAHAAPRPARFFGMFARLAQPIGYSAPDAYPVDLVFLLLSPEDAGKAHLAALACVCRRLRSRNTADAIRATRDAGRIYELLTGLRVTPAPG